jgi:hypothetical protein
MTDEQFWGILEQARAGKPASADPERLRKVLNKPGDDDLMAFGLMFYGKLCDLNHWRLWGAGYVIAGGMGDDGFHYFRSWIVGKGKRVFDLALNSPDDLGPFVDNPEVENELLEYVAVEVAEKRGLDDPRDRSERFPDSDPEGEPFKEETVAGAFPRLAAKFG